MKNSRHVVVVLDNIRSVHNVGSIFRTSDCAGAEKIYLCGTTPSPVDRFGRKRKDFQKVSLGAEENLPWQYFESTELTLKSLKKEGFDIVAVEQNKNSIDYRKYKPTPQTAFVFGAEVLGVGAGILDISDAIIEIPMHGLKESLNVSVAAGVILFSLE